MTTRGQILRSSVTGNAPAAGTRAPGEMWTTFPDLQFGVIDASRNAQKLIAVRYFSTSANYATGDFVVQAGALYAAKGAITAGAFNATQWTKLLVAADVPAALPIASTTVLGAVKVDGTSITASGSGVLTVPSTAVQAMNDNRIINGDMRIDQRNNGAGGTANNAYTVDRWLYASNQAAKGTWVRGGSGGSALPFGFTSFLSFTSSSAYASLATDFFYFGQRIEADMITDFAWGTPNAQPVTLSFWVSSAQPGTYSGAIRNDTGNRSYPFTFPVTATLTRIAITIPGDTVGAWVMNGNAVAAIVEFDLGSGSNFRGPANAWASANYIGATGAVSVVGANGATFNLTGVKLEIGSVATPFNRQSLAKTLADCQRYYLKLGGAAGGDVLLQGQAGSAGQNLGQTIVYPTSMRASPTGTVVGGITGQTNISAAVLVLSSRSSGFIITSAATGNTGWQTSGTSYLTFDAEL